jgi:hypothetical protein
MGKRLGSQRDFWRGNPERNLAKMQDGGLRMAHRFAFEICSNRIIFQDKGLSIAIAKIIHPFFYLCFGFEVS